MEPTETHSSQARANDEVALRLRCDVLYLLTNKRRYADEWCRRRGISPAAPRTITNPREALGLRGVRIINISRLDDGCGAEEIGAVIDAREELERHGCTIERQDAYEAPTSPSPRHPK